MLSYPVKNKDGNRVAARVRQDSEAAAACNSVPLLRRDWLGWHRWNTTNISGTVDHDDRFGFFGRRGRATASRPHRRAKPRRAFGRGDGLFRGWLGAGAGRLL